MPELLLTQVLQKIRPPRNRSVFVYPCYFLFANRHSFNCSVGLPPGLGRQGSLHFNVHVVFAKWYHVFGRDPVLCLVGAGWQFLRRWKHDLATFISSRKYFQSVEHQSSSQIEPVFFYSELSLRSRVSLLLVTSTELVLRVPTSRGSDVFAHIKSGATHCYVFIISSREQFTLHLCM